MSEITCPNGQPELVSNIAYVSGKGFRLLDNSDYKMSIEPGYVLLERPPNYEVELNEQPEVLADISAFCKAVSRRKVLIRGPRTKVNLSGMDIMDLGKEIAKLDLQIAVVESHDASNEDVSFLQNVVWNRGGSIKFFESEMEAKYWLRIS